MENQGYPNIKETKDRIAIFLGVEQNPSLDQNEESLFATFLDIDKKVAKFHQLKRINHQDNSINRLEDIFYDLINSMFNNLGYEQYDLIDVFIHEKGLSHASVYGLDPNGQKHNFNISIEDFNHFFKLIKKSKRKLFQASQLSFVPNFLGTFLARDYNFHNFNIIVVFTKNGFLPAQESEQEFFFKYTDHFYNSLNYATSLFSIRNLYGQLISAQNEISGQLKQNNDSAEIHHHQRIIFLGELLNTLRHELSNPLFGMRMSSEIMADDELPEEVLEIIRDINLNTTRCEEIIKNFTDLYHQADLKTNFSIKDAINETLKLTKSEHKTIEKKINFNSNNMMITTNRTWFIQVCFNLIINSSHAIKAKDQSRENHISINIFDDDRNYFIQIGDTGIGINQNNLENIFKPFFTTKPQGTGLGLSICYNLVQKMKGELHFESTAGQGTKFTMKLPKEI